MTASGVRDVILQELTVRGYGVRGEDMDLISAGVNSVALIQILSALEDAFDLDLDTARLFSRPVTVAWLETEIRRIAAAPPTASRP